MAMTRFDPREKFADRLWTREQVLTKVAPLPEWLSGPCRLSLNGSWLMICDDVKKACWNEPLPEFGDYNGLIRAFNAMPIEPGCEPESPFGRPENVNHKRQGYDDRQWTPEEVAMAKTTPAEPGNSFIPRLWQAKQEAEDAKNRRVRAVLESLAAKPGPWKNADEKPAPTFSAAQGAVQINGKVLDMQGVVLKKSDPQVDLQGMARKAIGEELAQQCDDAMAEIFKECGVTPEMLEDKGPPRTGREILVRQQALRGDRMPDLEVDLEELRLELSRGDQVVDLSQYIEPFHPTWPPPKQKGEDWEIWSKRRNAFIRVGRDAPRTEVKMQKAADPLTKVPHCAQCKKPILDYDAKWADDKLAVVEVVARCHGKTHRKEVTGIVSYLPMSGEVSLVLDKPIEMFEQGWDK